jgi:hypothetical protein
MTIYIDDLLDHLKKLREKHGNLEVCKIGHFGEINEMDLFDINVYMAYEDMKTERKVINVDTPDIGPEPD